jgi:hypothetical protein
MIVWGFRGQEIKSLTVSKIVKHWLLLYTFIVKQNNREDEIVDL